MRPVEKQQSRFGAKTITFIYGKIIGNKNSSFITITPFCSTSYIKNCLPSNLHQFWTTLERRRIQCWGQGLALFLNYRIFSNCSPLMLMTLFKFFGGLKIAPREVIREKPQGCRQYV